MLTFVAFGILCWTVRFVFPYFSIDCISAAVVHSAFVLLDSISIILFVLYFIDLNEYVPILYMSSPFIFAPSLAVLFIFVRSHLSVF